MWLNDQALPESAERGFAEWLVALQAYGEALVVDDPSGDGECLSRLIDLLETAPLDLALPFGVHANAATLRGAINADSFESVALRIVGDRCGFMISHGVQGLFYVTVVLGDHEVEVSADGGTFARACCKAVVLAVLALLEVHPAI